MASRTSLIAPLLVAVPGCGVPTAQPLEPHEVVAIVDRRAEPSVEVLRAALALHDVPPLGLVVPDHLDPSKDPGSDWFWHVHAIAFEPSVRATRRAWRAARQEVGVAGQPGPVRVGYAPEDIGPGASQHELEATVDLLSLLGLGTRPASKNVAAAAVGVALGHVEEAVWHAVFAVDRARVELATASGRQGALAALLSTAETDLRRLELLHERGRLGDGPVGRARAILADLRTQHSQRAAATVAARAGLARASGLPPRSKALDAIGPADLSGLAAAPESTAPSPAPRQLLDRLPALRTTRLAYAMAEARLRAAVSEWWPSLRLGPHLKFRPDDILYGGVLSLDLPWPGAVSAGIEAALEQRAAAREAVEDSLTAAMVTAAARRQELLLAQAHLARDVVPREQGSAAAWRSARAHLWVHEGPDIVETWADALQLRIRGVLARLDAVERLGLAGLAFHEAIGAAPGLARGKGAPGT